MTRVIQTLIVLVALCALAVPAAQASYQDVIKDCAQDGKLDKKYSDAELIKAKKKLPADVNEYSDCREVIGAAIGGAGRPSGGGGSGGGSSGGAATGGPPAAQAARAQDKNALAKIAHSARKPRVKVGDHLLAPGKNGLFSTASARERPAAPAPACPDRHGDRGTERRLVRASQAHPRAREGPAPAYLASASCLVLAPARLAPPS